MFARRTPKILLFFLLVLAFALPAFAGDAPGPDAQIELAHADQPQPTVLTELQKEQARIHAEFARFAQTWVAMLNRNHRFSRSRMKVEHLDGGYVAHYNLMDGDTIICQIRPTSSKSVPYLGILKYKERRYERTADSATECMDGDFRQISIVAHTEIFNYQNGRWN